MQSSELDSSLHAAAAIALDYIQRRVTSLGVVCDHLFCVVRSRS